MRKRIQSRSQKNRGDAPEPVRVLVLKGLSMYEHWTETRELPDELLDLIQHYRRVLEAAERRANILKHGTNVKFHEDFEKKVMMIMRLPTASAIPFHNVYPYEVFHIDGQLMCVGMWTDRDREIYLFPVKNNGCDMKAVFEQQPVSLHSRVQCRRIQYRNEWHLI